MQSYYLGMSLQNMNQMRLVPKKDYVANRLVSGGLQLAAHTSLFLDETKLEQGQLDTTGEASGSHRGATVRGAARLPPPTALSPLTLLPWLDKVNTHQVVSSYVCVCCCRCAQRHGPGEPDLVAEG